MNKQVSHIGIAALVLLSALIIGTTYWQTWANAGLANRQDNDIRLVAQFTIKRGKIYASDGRTLLATNVTKDRAGQTLYFRRYPTGPIFSDVVGYSTQTRNRTGIEQSYNDYLTGSNANLDTVFRSALDKLRGSTVTGNDLVLTIRPNAQALALQHGLALYCRRIATDLARAHLSGLGYEIPPPRRTEPGMPGLWDLPAAADLPPSETAES